MLRSTSSDPQPRSLRQLSVSLFKRYGFLNWTFGDQGLVSAANLLTTILLARFLGIEEFGRFTLAWTVIQAMTMLHHSLVISPMMSISPKQAEGDRPAYFGAAVTFHAGFVICVAVAIFSGALVVHALFPNWNVGGLALPLAFLSIATNVHEFLRRYFFTKGFLSLAFRIDAVRYALQIGLLFGLVQVTSFDAALGLWLMSASALVGFAVYVMRFERLAWDADVTRAVLARHWNFSSWKSLGLTIEMVVDYLYFFVAGGILGAAAVGAANAARALLGVSRIVNAAIENIAPIQAALRFHDGGAHSLTRYLAGVGAILAVLTVGMIAVIALAPEFWLRLAFGAEYEGYGNLVLWWAAIHVLYAGLLLLNAGLSAIERTKAMFVASLLSALFGITCAYALVSLFGLNGVLGGIFAMAAIRISVFFVALFRHLSRMHKSAA